MALNSLGLGFVFTARDLASGQIDKLKGKLTGLEGTSDKASARMSKGFGLAAASVVPLAVGAGTLAGTFGLAKFAAPFEQGVQRVGNIAGATAQELKRLRDAAIDAGLRTQFSPDQAVDGLGALAAQGFNTDKSIGLLNESLALAAGGQIGIEDATRSAAAAIRVFNEESTEQRSIADRLLKITNMTALGAGDLTLALGTVSKGAGLTKQSMDEMLISMGLVRNAGLDVSVAASSVSSGLQFIAKNAEGFKKELGIAVTDAEGNFRQFVDIVAEADQALNEKFTNGAERTAVAMKLFGRFGVSAFQNVSNQLKGMVGTVPGVLTMQDAITKLRDDMANAGGTATQFADNLLNTFAGQSSILAGATQTLGVVIGEQFAKVFKPIVKFVADTVSAMARAFDSLPDGVKSAIATFTVVASAILAVAGAVGVVAGISFALSGVFSAIGAAMVAALPIIAGITAAVAALAGGIALFRHIAQRNIGGFGDFLGGTFHSVSVAFRSLFELFSTGKLSGSLAEEFLKSGKGTQAFVTNLFRAGSRVMEFLGGIRDGFNSVLDTMGPSLKALGTAFDALGEAFGLVPAAMGDLKDFGGTGESVGRRLGEVFRVLVDVFTTVVFAVAKVIKILRGVWSFVSTVLSPVFWLLGQVVGFQMKQFGMFVDAVSAAVGAVNATINFLVQGLLTGIDFVMAGVRELMDFVVRLIGKAAQMIPKSMRPDVVNDMIKFAEGADTRRADRVGGLKRGFAQSRQSMHAVGSRVEVGALPPSAENAAILAELRMAREEARKARDEKQQQAVAVTVQMDGETVGKAVANADRKASARAFVPVSAGVEG